MSSASFIGGYLSFFHHCFEKQTKKTHHPWSTVSNRSHSNRHNKNHHHCDHCTYNICLRPPSSRQGRAEESIGLTFSLFLDKATVVMSPLQTVLVVTPDPALHAHVRYMAEYVLDLPPDECDKIDSSSLSRTIDTRGKFNVNPLSSGFYNSHYRFLWDFMEEESQLQNSQMKEHDSKGGTRPVQDVVMVATGSGIAGVLSIIEHAQKLGTIMPHGDERSQVPMTEVPVRLHVYCGVRSRQDMPYRAFLEDMAAKGQIRLSVVESANATKGMDKFYVQHAVKRDLETLFCQQGSSTCLCCLWMLSNVG